MRVTRWLEALNTKVGEFVGRFGMLIGSALMLLALIGEVLGWWNDLGLVMTVFGLGLAVWGLWKDSGSKVLQALGAQQGFLVLMADKQDAMLENQDAMLDHQDAMLDKQDAMLERQDRTIDVLDRIQAILDARLPGGT